VNPVAGLIDLGANSLFSCTMPAAFTEPAERMAFTDTGIPRIIHQTWRSRDVPPDKGDPESWQLLNPGWEYRFWSDDDLLAFMAAEFPELLALYRSYSKPVQRADLARYCLLRRYGGLYADIDTRCLAPLDILAGDRRVVLCEEPRSQHGPAHRRGLPTLLFNGTMASPPGHPFWDRVIGFCRLMAPQRDFDVLDTTGPLLVSAAYAQWPDQSEIALSSSQLFCGLTAGHETAGDPPFGPFGTFALSEHLWQGSWYEIHREPYHKRKLARLRQLRHRLFGGNRLTLAQARQSIDLTLLRRPLPPSAQKPAVTILIPVRDGETFLRRNIEQVAALSYPHDRMTVLYGEGDSHDRTAETIAAIAADYAGAFAAIGSVRLTRNGPRLERRHRWRAEHQRARRTGLAMARNDLLAAGLETSADWFLWLDADVVGLPTDLIGQLLAADAKIVTPDCVLEPGGPSYDLNAFVDIGTPSRVDYYRHLRGGLFQPPADYWVRRHLHDLRYLERVPLNGVGGTALLVHGDVHRAGLTFPEIPYRDLVETEAFGQLAHDLGVVPVGLPRVEVVHDRT